MCQSFVPRFALGILLAVAWVTTASSQQPPIRRSDVRRAAMAGALGGGVRYAGGDCFAGGCGGGNCADGHCAVGDCDGGSCDGPVDGGLIGEPCFGDEIVYDGCDAGFCGDAFCGPCACFSAGVEFTFMKPHFENNAAFRTLQSDGATFDNYTTTEFDYSTKLAPRVWLEMRKMGPYGLRATYWQYDERAADVTGTPDANGFGRIEPPPFGDVDLSTSTPGSSYQALSDINAYNVDLEGTNCFSCGIWGCTASAGLRFAEIEQQYNGTLTNADGNTQGSVNFNQRLQGIGPTISLRTQRPVTCNLSLFGFARGALLYGDSESALNAVEDQDLDTSFTTTELTARNDVLPMGELQVGLQFTPAAAQVWFPYMHFAMEGQLWGGAGNSSSEFGNVGFYGFNFALGLDW